MAGIPTDNRWDHGELRAELQLLIARGLSVREAAARLGVSPATAYRALS